MPDTPGPLTRLLRDAVAQPGETYERIADRSADPDTGERQVSPSWLHKLATGQVRRAPELAVLRAVAAGLGLPAAVVQHAAAAEWLGYEPREVSGLSEDVRVIVALLGDLDPADVARIRRMIEVW